MGVIFMKKFDRVTDTQGYSVYGWVKFVVPDFNKLPYSLRLQGDN